MTYEVSLKLSENQPRKIRVINPQHSFLRETCEHETHGWYTVTVFASNEQSALERAKKRLADYKNVSVDDFFENYEDRVSNIDDVLVCTTCNKKYLSWDELPYEVCPECRRRCKVITDPEVHKKFGPSPEEAFATIFGDCPTAQKKQLCI